jgi:octaprenyl-diphosphate synthase
MCVALAAKLGTGFGPAARDLAVSVELIHSATLLHDDVVDFGDRRRGAPTARSIYGNAASIFAGDWLLIEALKRIQRADLPGVTDYTLAIIEEMIEAEALQLENRGRVNGSRDDYLRVIEGKTAALFRLAMYAGGRAGHLDDGACTAIERYGAHLGVAFQAIDDLLDFAGDASHTGKSLFADLREGKMTYPLLVALERDTSLQPLVEEILEGPANEPVPVPLVRPVVDAMAATGGMDECTALAHQHARAAIDCLDPIADGRGRDALITVAQATVHRQR